MPRIKIQILLVAFIVSFTQFLGCKSQENTDEDIKLTAISSLERIMEDEPIFGNQEVTIKAAKNEYESFQVVTGGASTSVRVINAEVSDLEGDNGIISKNNITLYRPDYVRIMRSSPRAQLPPGLYPDPLVPFINPIDNEPIQPRKQIREKWHDPIKTIGHEIYGIPFDLWKGQNQPIWVDVFIPESTVAGEYKGKFTVTVTHFPNPWGGELENNSEERQISIPINLTVWDFTLPSKATMRNSFGRIESITRDFDVKKDSALYDSIELRYCRMYSENRLNAPLPNYLLPEVNADGSLKTDPQRTAKLKKFIKDFNVADFEIPNVPIWYFHNPSEKIKSTDSIRAIKYYSDYYKYLHDNEWVKRAYVYMYDEPNTPEDYQRVRELSALIRTAAPQLKILVVEQPYTQDPSWPSITNSIDIWCPLFGFIDRDSVNEALSRGNEVWSYTALSQRAPGYHPQYEKVKYYDSPYWHTDAKLAAYRNPVWMNYQYGISGILYWSVTTKVLDSWYLPTFSHFGSHFNGGGYLIYPGKLCGIEGPIASIRLKNVRDAMEDYEYFKLYEQLAGKETVLKIVSEVAPNWWNISYEPHAILSARDKIAEQIVKLQKPRAQK